MRCSLEWCSAVEELQLYCVWIFLSIITGPDHRPFSSCTTGHIQAAHMRLNSCHLKQFLHQCTPDHTCEDDQIVFCLIVFYISPQPQTFISKKCLQFNRNAAIALFFPFASDLRTVRSNRTPCLVWGEVMFPQCCVHRFSGISCTQTQACQYFNL